MLIPFDIELAQLALFAETGKIVTKGGKEVKITCWNNPVNFNYPIVGQIAGAYYGIKNIPSEWIRNISNWDNYEIPLRGYILQKQG